jgi:hypothetical protein
MFCCKIFILSVLIQKYDFATATVEFNSKQLLIETNLFRTDNHSVESRKFKQLKVNSKEKNGSENQTSLSFLIPSDIKTAFCRYTRL